MKRFLIVLAVLAAVVLPAAAQDFSSPTPQFVAFNIGVVVGPELLDDAGIAGGTNFGVDFAIIDNLTVGFDRIVTASNNAVANVTRSYNGIRLSYNFTPQIGAALGFGSADYTGGSGIPGDPETVTLGLYTNLFSTRGASGIASGLKIRADYVVPVNELAQGALLFVVGYSFGL
jgi:hypothetical protein